MMPEVLVQVHLYYLPNNEPLVGKQKLKKCPKLVPLTLSFRQEKSADLLG